MTEAVFVTDTAAVADTTLLACLSSQECNLWANMRAPKRRRQYLLSRAALRYVYAADVPYELTTRRYGQPVLIGIQGEKTIALSHAGTKVLISRSQRGAVGCDVEEIRARRGLLLQLERARSHPLLSERERHWIRAASALPEVMHKRFFALWTIKEAIGKSLGFGIYQGLRQWSVELAALNACIEETRGSDHTELVAEHDRHPPRHLYVGQECGAEASYAWCVAAVEQLPLTVQFLSAADLL